MRRRQLLAILATVLTLGACSPGPRSVALTDLAETPERWNGSEIRITGTLRSYIARKGYPEHFWVENETLDRVGVEGAGQGAGQGADWRNELRPLVGWTVELEGTFRYDRRAGRRIEVTSISSAR